MAKYKYLLYSLISLTSLTSCPGNDKEPESPADPTGIRILKEYYTDGKIKSETGAIGKLRQGESKDYRKDGTLENVITYENNSKHGRAANYYPDGKTLKTEMTYVNGYKHGDAFWYYPDGKIYRKTPYVNGHINGIRITYYENGSIQAETPYLNGNPGIGLKEYTQDGKLKSYDAKIRIREIDKVSLDNSFTLVFSLSDKSRNVKFYQGKLSNGIYWNEQLEPIPTENGVARLQFHISKGAFKMETMSIVARDKTKLNHTYILKKEYHLAVENKF